MPAQGTAALTDRYALEDVIGRGGMAEVYRARDLVLDRPLAVKVLRAATTNEARFISEARTLARLSHPGLVTLLDAGTDGEQPYLVMELVGGTTLAECCRGLALDQRHVAATGAQLADALAYVHNHGIVHRDVKPGNVLLGDDGRVLLTDFGIAKLTEETAGLTATGLTMGTAAYLAPEQVRRGDIGPATDVYSLGLVLLEALTGERAYAGPPAEAALARLSCPPAVPNELPAEWRALLQHMTAPDPGDRPSMAEVASALRNLTTGVDTDPATARLRAGLVTTEPLSTPLPTDDVPVVPRGRRLADQFARVRATVQGGWSCVRPQHRRVAAGLLLVAVLLLVPVVALLTTGGDGATPPETPPNLPPHIREDLQDLHRAVNG